MAEIYTYGTNLFTVPFYDFSCSSTGGNTYSDLWSFTGTTLGRFELCEINIGQKSSNVAGNQQLDVQILRGTTALGGAAAVTPANLKGWPGAPVANTKAFAPSSTNVASTASATLIIADNSDYSGNYEYRAHDWEEIILDYGQNLTIRVSAPAAAVTLSGWVAFKETTKQR